MSTARSAALTVFVGACSTHHLSIGNLDPAADSGVVKDAHVAPIVDSSGPAEPNDQSIDAEADEPGSDAQVDAAVVPLQASLRFLGHDDISSITVGCGAPCTDVEVDVQGGVPPYQIRWGDGQLGPSASLCPTTNVIIPVPGAPAAVAEVSDSAAPTPNKRVFLPALSTPGDCGPDGGAFFRACVGFEGQPSCAKDAGGIWYDLRAPWNEPRSTALFSFAVDGLGSANVEFYAASALCDGLTRIGGGFVQALAHDLTVPLSAMNPPPRYLMVRAPNMDGGRLPTSITSGGLELCFER